MFAVAGKRLSIEMSIYLSLNIRDTNYNEFFFGSSRHKTEKQQVINFVYLSFNFI